MAISTNPALPRPPGFGNLSAMQGEIPNRLREWRKARGLTLDQLAERLGTTNQTLSRYERGERSLTIDLLLQIAPHLDCKPADLLPDPESAWSDDARRLAVIYEKLEEADRAALLRVALSLGGETDKVVPLRRKLS